MMKHKKRGFTLLEMMTVVAVVAILIAIIVPTVSNAGVKARAATNAANLRAVEGKLAAIRATNPDSFDTWASTLEETTPDIIEDIFTGIFDGIFGAGSADKLNQSMRTVTARNGILTLQLSPDTEIGAPQAKGIEVEGFTLAAGTEMKVYIGNDVILVSYGDYTKDDFADIAEDGEYNGESKKEEEEEEEKPSICLTPDTQIALADGTTKAVKDLNYEDQIIAWNHFTGEYQVTSASYIVYHGEAENCVITLRFSDGNFVEIVGGHGFFDMDENKYIFINAENVVDYVGHGFVKQSGNSYEVVTLVDYDISMRVVGSYSLASIACNNAMANGMFSLTPVEDLDSENFFNFLAMGDNLKYDEVALNEHNPAYGLFTYEDLADYMTEEAFAGFEYSNGCYLKIAVAKGYVTIEQILKMLNPADMVAAE